MCNKVGTVALSAEENSQRGKKNGRDIVLSWNGVLMRPLATAVPGFNSRSHRRWKSRLLLELAERRGAGLLSRRQKVYREELFWRDYRAFC